MLHRLIHTVALCLVTLFCASAALAAEQGTTVIYYHHDVRGDPIVVTTETGQIQWIESYRGYGEAEPRVSSEGIGFGDNADENHDNRMSFTGHESDGGSGLTYMKARYYDPLVGRFYSNDPVGFRTTNTMMFNRYAYANNNPYKFVDPDGRQSMLLGVDLMDGIPNILDPVDAGRRVGAGGSTPEGLGQDPNLKKAGNLIGIALAAGIMIAMSESSDEEDGTTSSSEDGNGDAETNDPDLVKETWPSLHSATGHVNPLEDVTYEGKTKQPGLVAQGYTKKYSGTNSDGEVYTAFKNPETGGWTGGHRSSANDK